MYIHSFSHILLHDVPSQMIRCSSLCYTVGPHCLSTSNAIVCIYCPQTPRSVFFHVWTFLGFSLLFGACFFFFFYFVYFNFSVFCLFRAAPAAYGDSQARDLIGAVAAGLPHSHSNARSKPCLRPTPQLTAKPDP